MEKINNVNSPDRGCVLLRFLSHLSDVLSSSSYLTYITFFFNVADLKSASGHELIMLSLGGKYLNSFDSKNAAKNVQFNQLFSISFSMQGLAYLSKNEVKQGRTELKSRFC